MVKETGDYNNVISKRGVMNGLTMEEHSLQQDWITTTIALKGVQLPLTNGLNLQWRDFSSCQGCSSTCSHRMTPNIPREEMMQPRQEPSTRRHRAIRTSHT